MRLCQKILNWKESLNYGGKHRGKKLRKRERAKKNKYKYNNYNNNHKKLFNNKIIIK